MDQPKIERLLRVMKMLTANHSLTVEEIADKLSISSRSVYRYIDTFREAGFVIKKKDEFFKLDTSSPYFKDISELIHFTEEEAYILKSAIESIDENHLLKQNLKKKLYTVYDYKILAESTVSSKNAHNIHLLTKAMETKKQVILKNYSSAHGKDIRDRAVEPFAFTTNYVQVWCYSLSEETIKLFKVSRIGSVEILSTEWQNQNHHKTGFLDIFRMNSDKTMKVKLKLGHRAANLLIEEFPLASNQLTALSPKEWLLETEICSFEGIGRFVMGLLDDIQIIESPEFEQYLANRIHNFQSKFPLS